VSNNIASQSKLNHSVDILAEKDLPNVKVSDTTGADSSVGSLISQTGTDYKVSASGNQCNLGATILRHSVEILRFTLDPSVKSMAFIAEKDHREYK
jgi:hypothetical protein